MTNSEIQNAFSNLTTPLIADAAIRAKIPLRAAPPGLRPICTGMKAAGHARPVRHYGSVDVFLEAIEDSNEGDVLIIDNNGRLDEGCIGDLTVLEARAGGLSGLIVWGAHRDSAELGQIGFPVFSYGKWPFGPLRLDAREKETFVSAKFGNCVVGREDVVFADDDGCLFAAANSTEELLRIAHTIWKREREQAELVKQGVTLRQQFKFSEYLSKRSADNSYTLRQHLRSSDAAIEE